jgi:hypothetical protein
LEQKTFMAILRGKLCHRIDSQLLSSSRPVTKLNSRLEPKSAHSATPSRLLVSVIEAASVWRAAAAFKGRTIAYVAAGQYPLADRGEVAGRYPAAASYYERGLAWLCMEEYDKAVLDFRKALEFSDHPGAHCGLSGASVKLWPISLRSISEE